MPSPMNANTASVSSVVTLTYFQTLRSGRKVVRTKDYTTTDAVRTMDCIRRSLGGDIVISLICR